MSVVCKMGRVEAGRLPGERWSFAEIPRRGMKQCGWQYTKSPPLILWPPGIWPNQHKINMPLYFSLPSGEAMDQVQEEQPAVKGLAGETHVKVERGTCSSFHSYLQALRVQLCLQGVEDI